MSRCLQAAVGHMPFPGHRTQKEVREDAEIEQTDKQRMADAKRGSERLLEAIRAAYVPVARSCGSDAENGR